MANPADLDDAAYRLADEIRDGKWRPPAGSGSEADKQIEELRRRCPGHTLAEYRQALGKGFFDSR